MKLSYREQGRIQGRTVADGWAGAETQKSLVFQCYRRIDRPTWQGVESRVRDLKY